MLLPLMMWHHRPGHLLIGPDLALETRLWLVLHGVTRHPSWQDHYNHAKALYPRLWEQAEDATTTLALLDDARTRLLTTGTDVLTTAT